MSSLELCFVDKVTEAVQIFDVGLDTTASSFQVPYQRSEVSSTEELAAHFQNYRELPCQCRVMLVNLVAPRLWVDSCG